MTHHKDEQPQSLEALRSRIASLEAELARYRQGTPAMRVMVDLLRTFPGPLALEDADGRLLRLNQAFAELIGLDSVEAARNKRLEDLLEDAKPLADLRRGDEVVLKEGRRYAYELRWQLSPDEEARYFSVVKAPITSEVEGKPLLLLFLQEITPWWHGLAQQEGYLSWWKTLAEFARAIFSEGHLSALMETASHWLARELGYDCVAVYLFEEEEAHFLRRFRSTRCEAMEIAAAERIGMEEDHWLMPVWREARPFFRRWPEGEVRPLVPMRGGEPVALALPLKTPSRKLGILILASERPRELDEVALRALDILSIQLALAIQSMVIQERVQRNVEISDLIAEITREVERSQSYEELLRALTPLMDYLDFEGVTLRLLVRRERDLYFVDRHTLRRVGGTMQYAATREMPVPRATLTPILKQDSYIFCPDAQHPSSASALPEIREQMLAQGLRASLTLPLRVRGRMLGLLVFYSTHPAPSIPLSRLFVSLREIVTYAVDRRRLFDRMEATIRQRELLYSALAELSAASSYDELLDALRKHTFIGEADRNISINRFDRPWVGDDAPDWSIVLARWTQLPQGATRSRYPLHLFPDTERLLKPDTPTIIEDIATDPRLSPASRQLYQKNFRAGSTIFFPLVASGQWIGYINAIFSEPRHFPMEDVRAVMTLVNQAAVIIQSLYRLSEMERRARRLMVAAEVSKATTAIVDLEELLFRAVEVIRERFDLYYVGIFLVDEAREWAILRAGTGEAGRKMLEAGHRLKVGGRSMIGACVATGEPRIALDVGREAVHFNNPHLPETRSEMALPLRSGGQIIGAMTIQSTEEAAFSDEDVVVLQTMADQLANAIQVSRLLRSTERNLEQLQAAYGKYTLEAWHRLIERSGALGYRYRGLEVERVQEKNADAEKAWREGRLVLRQDESGEEASVAVPIKLRDQVIGVLSMHAREGGISPSALQMVEAITNRLALALETTRLLEETRRSVMREQLVTSIGARVREKLEIEAVLESALSELGRALNAQRAEAVLSLQAARTAESEEGEP